MITTEHGYIRGAEPDDAPALHRMYDRSMPRAAVLDPLRELVMPTEPELREMLGREEMAKMVLYAVEDQTGQVCGFCSLRGMSQEARFGEFAIMFLAVAQYADPLADDVIAFLCDRAFKQVGLRKVVCYCLDCEEGLQHLYDRHGFTHEGTQRDVFYSQGRYFGLEVYSLFSPNMSEPSTG